MGILAWFATLRSLIKQIGSEKRIHPRPRSRRGGPGWILLVPFVLAACSPAARTTPVSTPVDFLLTAAAQTLNVPSQAAANTPLAPTLEMATSPSPAAQDTPAATILPGEPAPSPTRTPSSSPTRSATLTSIPPSPLPGSPTLTLRPTRTPTITPTAYAPNAALAILQPGPQSRITSPLRVRAYVRPGSDGRVRLELFGEDGRLLFRKLLVYSPENQSIYIDEVVDFEIPGVAESARLQFSTYDTYGRLTTLATQDMVLLDIGKADITPPGLLDEPVLIRQPRPNQFVQGGTLLVSGLISPFNDQPLLIELIDRQGKVVGYRQAAVTIDSTGGYTPFTVEIPYQVSRATYVMVTVKVYSNTRISGIIYATAREVLISP